MQFRDIVTISRSYCEYKQRCFYRPKKQKNIEKEQTKKKWTKHGRTRPRLYRTRLNTQGFFENCKVCTRLHRSNIFFRKASSSRVACVKSCRQHVYHQSTTLPDMSRYYVFCQLRNSKLCSNCWQIFGKFPRLNCEVHQKIAEKLLSIVEITSDVKENYYLYSYSKRGASGGACSRYPSRRRRCSRRGRAGCTPTPCTSGWAVKKKQTVQGQFLKIILVHISYTNKHVQIIG